MLRQTKGYKTLKIPLDFKRGDLKTCELGDGRDGACQSAHGATAKSRNQWGWRAVTNTVVGNKVTRKAIGVERGIAR